VGAYDPMAMEGARKELGSIITYSSDARECVKGSDLVIIMTAWDEFRKLGSTDLARLMGGKPKILDARRIYSPEKFATADFSATGLGTQSI
jgi:UDPglucose 6-dehydrogenase